MDTLTPGDAFIKKNFYTLALVVLCIMGFFVVSLETYQTYKLESAVDTIESTATDASNTAEIANFLDCLVGAVLPTDIRSRDEAGIREFGKTCNLSQERIERLVRIYNASEEANNEAND